MVDILLATYNGERFLNKQIDSILGQSYHDWFLYVRDDGSIDSTLEILATYNRKYPDKIKIVKDRLGNLGVSGNFYQLMKYSTAPYIMYCDQDDIWKEDKISKELSYIKEYEKKYRDVPILIFSDLAGIDENDNLIFESFIRKNKYKVNKIIFSQLLFRNVVTGCTILMNRNLLSNVSQMPTDILLHDYWAVLVCMLSKGEIGYLDETTILYRQHVNNCIGDLSLTIKDKVINIFNLSNYQERKKRSIEYYRYLERQMVLLKKICKPEINSKEEQLLNLIINIWYMPPLKRAWLLYKNNCLPNDWYLTLIMLMYYMFWGR